MKILVHGRWVLTDNAHLTTFKLTYLSQSLGPCHPFHTLNLLQGCPIQITSTFCGWSHSDHNYFLSGPTPNYVGTLHAWLQVEVIPFFPLLRILSGPNKSDVVIPGHSLGQSINGIRARGCGTVPANLAQLASEH